MTQMLVGGGALVGATVAVAVLFGGVPGSGGARAAAPLPAPAPAAETGGGPQVAVFAGGCFWGMQEVFEHVKGVLTVTAGYAGGSSRAATYEQVSTGTTGNAESIRITFDPRQVSYGQLLQVFFGVAHDPTQRDRQGPDVGSQYRSAIWYTTPDQQRSAEAYIHQLEQSRVFPRPIVTEVAPFRVFTAAESYHQGYADRHPHDLYIVINDAPKVERLRAQLPALYRASRAPVDTGLAEGSTAS